MKFPLVKLSRKALPLLLLLFIAAIERCDTFVQGPNIRRKWRSISFMRQ
jgi:hypothetical protein